MKPILPLLVCFALFGCKSTPEPFVVQATPPMPQARMATPPPMPSTRNPFAPPAPPQGPVVMLAFDAPADSTVTGFKIYYRNEAGVTNSVDVGTSTTNSIPLVAGEAYKLWAKSYNAAGVESVPSNEVSYTVPITVPPQRWATIVLSAGPTAQGPFPVALTTNRVQVSVTNAFFNQKISYE